MSLEDINILRSLYAGAVFGLLVAIPLIFTQLYFKTRDLFVIYLIGLLGIMIGTLLAYLEVPIPVSMTPWQEAVYFGIGYLVLGIPAIQWMWLYECKKYHT